jgi:hypothetical protein
MAGTKPARTASDNTSLEKKNEKKCVNWTQNFIHNRKRHSCETLTSDNFRNRLLKRILTPSHKHNKLFYYAGNRLDVYSESGLTKVKIYID